MTDDSIRVLICDDYALVRVALCTLIATEPGLSLAGEAADGVEAVTRARLLKPDVILMDMSMPRKDGLTAIQEIKQENPAARVLVLTSFAEDDKIFLAIKAGAQGYLFKNSSRLELLNAIRCVYAGKISLHPVIARKLIRELNQPSPLPPTSDPLTEREVDVLKLVAQGLSNDEIAEKLSLSERTMRMHVTNILGKLHLANRTQAALYALREGIARLNET